PRATPGTARRPGSARATSGSTAAPDRAVLRTNPAQPQTRGQAAADHAWESQIRSAGRADPQSAGRLRATRRAGHGRPPDRARQAAAGESAPHSVAEASSPETCRMAYHSWHATRYDGWTSLLTSENEDRLIRARSTFEVAPRFRGTGS